VIEAMTPQETATMREEANRTWAQFFREAGIEQQ